MKASETSLRTLLEGTKQFQIPLFQRPYSWEKAHWEALWEDLISIYIDEVKGFYFLGPIVTQSIPGTAEGISPYIVIDGQQRLTTLTILLAALRDYIKKYNRETAEELYEQYLINKYKKDNDFFKVLPSQDDREVYKSIILAGKITDIKKEGKIYDAYKFFEKKLKKPSEEIDAFEAAKLKTILLERMMLVNITSDDQDNPYLIFESLNNKGQDLTQADLVRNYIFMRLPVEQQEVIYKEEWQPLQEQFRINGIKKEYSEDMTTAFWYYLRKDGEAVNEKAVYKSIKERFDKYENIKDSLQELVSFVKHYQKLNFYHLESESRLNSYFQRFNRLNFTTCQIFLLNVYDRYEKGSLSLENFEKVLIYLESYFVRRWISGISTRSLGNLFNKLSSQVIQTNCNNFVEGLYQVLNGLEGSQVWPDNDTFRQSVINQPIYKKSDNDRVKLILESLERPLSKEKVNPEELTIEHIMPQKLSKSWKEVLGKGCTSLHKKWLHTLGNLTLTGYNAELSNKLFEDKLTYFIDSNISLNKYFRNIKIWNEDAIQKRAENLAEIAIEVWPR